ncbi:hypothetical protein BDW02DRAFT_509169 [Decorospora gaudefroyi]|uniref:Uncharacterized protein n=1 Tax=Decorospora gaudefroyi TaxID=184978 RepID=A0A6A5K5R2_9PLEO|nr:hypothetical protein BDW02DRAFT_509169 [Decorospora gaudefroyi]
MGRFDTLNADTKDLVQCLLPALAASFKIEDPVEIIPEDIRMRAWDCERRDHIKNKTENDPRNWGVQFLKDLMAISRLKDGDLGVFQADLRAKVALHEPKHPWCRLGDIKELKDEYEHPGRKDQTIIEESSEESSTDSYFEELVEPEEFKGCKRHRGGNHEVYEARVIEKRKKARPARLRRSESGGYQRPEKIKKKRYSVDRGSATPKADRLLIHRRASRTIGSDHEDSPDSVGGRLLLAQTPAFSLSPGPSGVEMYSIETAMASNEPLAVQRLQAELEVAEAELKTARLRHQYLQARAQAEQEADHSGTDTQNLSHTFH